ncbi:MAG TPA: efflux RND transporter periplasmic adaptor subunit [Aeromonadales bacterium]|nr:efflux RND transporter periplasmic adaptor subunit [Aeromonadales bacterium]
MFHISQLKHQAVSISLLLLLLLAPDLKAEEAKDKVNHSSVPVTTVKVILENLQQIAQVQGDVETYTKPSIAAEVSGKIIAMHAFEGESVKKGQVLAEQDPEPLMIAREKALAEIQRIKALIENQKRVVQRNQKLKREKVVSQTRLDDAETALSLSIADLIVVKAQLKDVEYKLSHVKLISPFDGVIQNKFVSLGDYVKIGKPVYQLVSLKDIYARIYLPETLINEVSAGTKVTLSHNDQQAEGVITSFRPMLEKGNRALHALVKFENTQKWKPGLNIVARVLVQLHENAVTIPARTVVRRPDGNVVYKIVNSKAVEQKVIKGLRNGSQVEILQGLSEGDVIALDGAAFLSNGAAIEVMVNKP